MGTELWFDLEIMAARAGVTAGVLAQWLARSGHQCWTGLGKWSIIRMDEDWFRVPAEGWGDEDPPPDPDHTWEELPDSTLDVDDFALMDSPPPVPRTLYGQFRKLLLECLSGTQPDVAYVQGKYLWIRTGRFAMHAHTKRKTVNAWLRDCGMGRTRKRMVDGYVCHFARPELTKPKAGE
jgi:hypothetical protein